MKLEEFLLGAGIYALLIAAGYSGPILKKLEKLPWNKPADSLAWSRFHLSIPNSNPGANKILPVSGSPRISILDRPVVAPAVTRDFDPQDIGKTRERVAARHGVLGAGAKLSQAASPFQGIKTGSKLDPESPGKKRSNLEEPVKS